MRTPPPVPAQCRASRRASPGPLVREGDTHVLRGHCCPLLRLHDQGFCVHQAKAIEMANWKDRPFRPRPHSTPGTGEPPRATPIHGPVGTGCVTQQLEGPGPSPESRGLQAQPPRTAPPSRLSPLPAPHACGSGLRAQRRARPGAGRQAGNFPSPAVGGRPSIKPTAQRLRSLNLKPEGENGGPSGPPLLPPPAHCIQGASTCSWHAPVLSLAEAGERQSLI